MSFQMATCSRAHGGAPRGPSAQWLQLLTTHPWAQSLALATSGVSEGQAVNQNTKAELKDAFLCILFTYSVLS